MAGDSWKTRLDDVHAMMAEMSRQTNPQDMVRAYGERVRKLIPIARRISLSRRDLNFPQYRITRFSEWTDEINPWKQKDRLPLLSGGLFAELIYSNHAHLIDDLDVAPGDPAAPYLDGQRSLIAIPMLDGGEALNMVISTQETPHGFDREQLPDTFWMANLFGRATHNLVLKDQVREAYEAVDRELRVVSSIQRSLLPREMPHIPGLKLAAHYETSQRAGGDYYDFFPLANGQWGLFIADVSGHGTPAAVVMAITHCIAHLFPAETPSPGSLLDFVNRHLTRLYTDNIEAFVTAFYGVYRPETRTLRYATAGHNPPQLWSCSQQRAVSLNDVGGLPLGIDGTARYENGEIQLAIGDCLALYTDGITEAMSPTGELFGVRSLDRVLATSCHHSSQDVLADIIAAVDQHSQGAPSTDDKTLVVAMVTDH